MPCESIIKFMYNIADLNAMPDDELIKVAETMGMKKLTSLIRMKSSMEFLTNKPSIMQLLLPSVTKSKLVKRSKRIAVPTIRHHKMLRASVDANLKLLLRNQLATENRTCSRVM